MTRTVGLDTSAALWALNDKEEDAEHELVIRARAFVKESQDAKVILRLPAVVVGELMVKVPEGDRPEYLSKLATIFAIDAYDNGAALHAAEIQARWNARKKEKPDPNPVPGRRQCIKADVMILGTAIEHKYDALFVADGDFDVLSDNKMVIERLAEFVPSKSTSPTASQPVLPGFVNGDLFSDDVAQQDE